MERWLSFSLFSISELQSSFWLSYVSHLVKPSRHVRTVTAVQNIKKLDNSRRTTQRCYKRDQVPLCDKHLKAGWYRFMSFVGGEMPTKKVDGNHCGTLHPIWLRTPDDTHTCPSAMAAPVTVTAYVNFNERNVGCFYSFNVGVKFCPSNYFVYYLTPKLSCSIAYCAGKISLRY